MPKSLAELRTEKRETVAERPYTLCLAADLVAEVQALAEELDRLPQSTLKVDDERKGPPTRMGGGGNRRAKEIHARMAELLDEMAEYEGELRVRANKTDGEWRQWCNAHPAREEGEQGHDRDQRITYGYCNADDLVDDLGAYAHTWNSEPLTDGDWSMLNVGNADKQAIAYLVVSMYEVSVSIPKWRNALSASLPTGNDSTSRADSGSPSDDSSAGSLTSDTSTTTQTAT